MFDFGVEEEGAIMGKTNFDPPNILKMLTLKIVLAFS